MSARRWVPPTLWAALILLLTSLPNPSVGDVGIPGADKLLHGGLYLVLGWLTARASGEPGRRANFLHLMTVLLAIALFGAADEWHQVWIPGRAPDPRDWGADVLGAIVGIAVARFRLIRREPAT